jgi:hypothetical protein
MVLSNSTNCVIIIVESVSNLAVVPIQLRAAVMTFDRDYAISTILIFAGIMPALFLPHGASKKAAPAEGNIPIG